jgi:uncharacterized protein YhfF
VAGGDGVARVVVQTTEVRIGLPDSVDPQFAWDEGEGDRSLQWWFEEHRKFFWRCCEVIALSLADPYDLDAMDVIFQRFMSCGRSCRTFRARRDSSCHASKQPRQQR